MAKVLSSISGNLISAASAGYAPTNSADVSAIASAYQVVSATGTRLYAGTAHVTSINSAPISASRAGKAANASMATSAYYDGTGRLISSLPDSATVSSIASSYATGKVDKSAISAQSANWNSVYNTVSSNSASWSGSTGGGSVSSLSGTIFVSGDNIEGTNSAVLTASSEEGFTTSFDAGNNIPSWTSQELYAGNLPGSGATLYIPTNGPWGTTVIISGRDSNMAIVTASELFYEDPITIYLGAIVSQISASANNYTPITGDVTAEKTGGITVTGIGELAWASSVSGVVNTVSSNSATWGAGGVDSATVSAIASSYAESAVSGKADSSSLNSYAKSADVSATISAVSSNSANWGAVPTSITAAPDAGTNSAWFDQYGVSAELQGIASSNLGPRYLAIDSYPNTDDFSAVLLTPSKLEFINSASTATVNISSIDRWNTVSSKADSSALSSYALSADVSSTVDVVSTQSANWGGSALALSAGPGVKLEKVGNTLVASTDETVLWSGSRTSAALLSENPTNFSALKVMDIYNNVYEFTIDPTAYHQEIKLTNYSAQPQALLVQFSGTNDHLYITKGFQLTYGTWDAPSTSHGTAGVNTTYSREIMTKVVGVNRTAGV